ncbi:DNA polymerase III subunit gamma/tau [Clostridium sp. D2Q-14]|uniref:DNA polymerase III subunit gamma/tau n=1 Tax=Anaeromonas gelatinilytica TaxID=2683194 RepID=UPI00193B9B33|nr:DNA polymerase III subunit gamma/tau [Anaeromonas gelatinilytica]MBS4535893.1 DNA polymerase III subunit gamma/tau [Anaeromonas gelatinilytica]
MAYQAIYRRFRPRTFDEIIGQKHITTILKNQILRDNIAHAYLFSGTRGTGKTSTAKIFARSVNCSNNEDGNPCNHCEVCRGILEDNIMDVVEMDAASNNSVDDIRDLKEKVKYPPSTGKYKVYIIDEVHMLSKGAFNALLKTLEEPPKHLLFILATTEPQKLPATILSRCQRYDFKRITVKNIVKAMKDICNELDIEVEERGLNLIARNSDGAMRDALSILDQCVSFSEGTITYEYILSILGTVNNDIIFDMADYIIDDDLEKALINVDELVMMGKDVHQFIKDLINHFRNLMVAKSSDKLDDIIDGTEEMIEQFKQQSKSITLNRVISIIKLLSEAESNSKWSSQPRIILETTLMKMVSPELDNSLESILSRISVLEEKIENGNIAINKPSSKVKDNNKRMNDKDTKVIQRKTKKQIEELKPLEDNKNNTNEVKNSIEEDTSMKDIIKSWPNILKKIKVERISVQALLTEGTPHDLNNGILYIAFKDGFGFHKDAVDKEDNKIYIENTINSMLNSNIIVKFVMENEIDQQTNDNQDDSLKEEVIEVFGEDLVEIED